jgi:hypothetical protein
MSFDRPFSGMKSLAAAAAAALVLLAPALTLPAGAQAQQAALSNGAKSDTTKSDTAKSETPKSDTANAPTSQPGAPGNVAAVDPANPSQQKSLTTRAIEKVKQVAKSPTIFSGGFPACRPRAAPNRWGPCRMSRASSLPANR